MPNATDQFTLTKLFGNGNFVMTTVRDRTEIPLDTASQEAHQSSIPTQPTDQPGTQQHQVPESDPQTDMQYEESYPLPQASPKELLYKLRNATPQTTEETLADDIRKWRQYCDTVQETLEIKIQRQTEIATRLIDYDQNDPRIVSQTQYADALNRAKNNNHVLRQWHEYAHAELALAAHYSTIATEETHYRYEPGNNVTDLKPEHPLPLKLM